MAVLRFQPIAGQTENIIESIMDTAEVSSCSRKELFAIRLATEELVVNVVNYAYADRDESEAYLEVRIDKKDDCLWLTFVDGGFAFNPLEREMPDITLSAEERQIGGLGIFMTIKMMDEVTYERTSGENRLTLKKMLSA